MPERDDGVTVGHILVGHDGKIAAFAFGGWFPAITADATTADAGTIYTVVEQLREREVATVASALVDGAAEEVDRR